MKRSHLIAKPAGQTRHLWRETRKISVLLEPSVFCFYKRGLSLSLSHTHTHIHTSLPLAKAKPPPSNRTMFHGIFFCVTCQVSRVGQGPFGDCVSDWTLNILNHYMCSSDQNLPEHTGPHGSDSLYYSHSNCVRNCLSCYSFVVKLVQSLC